ncbi:SMI1/KNR4 family protein [Undibacterium squillarum]|uniref:SMI1/KNR4 family protein n=1 Tax=Undibacterium squillarum TaxID=1131567 RepID=UPI0035B18A0F
MNQQQLLALHPHIVLPAPATPVQLQTLATTVAMALPADIVSLLSVADGVAIQDEEAFLFVTLLYGSERIAEETQHFRLWWQREHPAAATLNTADLLIIADDGGGNYFALQAQPESASLIFRLDHETGEAELCEGLDIGAFIQEMAASLEE